MPDNHGKDDLSGNPLDEDAFLNKLIRASREPGEAKFIRPDEEAIAAYLMGTATPAQESAVKAALMSSAEFRREILGMAEDIDALSSASAQEIEKQAEMIRPPSYREFLAKRGQGVQSGGASDTLWTRLTRWRIPQLYAPLAVAAVIVVLIVVQTGVFTVARKPAEPQVPPSEVVTPASTQVTELAQWLLMDQDIDQGLLISNVTRGATISAAQAAYGTAQEAAMAVFRSVVTYDNGVFRPDPAAKITPPASPYRTASLILAAGAGGEIRYISAAVPIGRSEDTGLRPEAWVLTLPARDLYKIEMQDDTTMVQWTPAMGDTACITFIYPEGKRYKAVGFEWKLR